MNGIQHPCQDYAELAACHMQYINRAQRKYSIQYCAVKVLNKLTFNQPKTGRDPLQQSKPSFIIPVLRICS